MNCIIVNDDIPTTNAFKTLINQTESLTLLTSFNKTLEASRFISENTVDLVFLDIQIDETISYGFIKTIPYKTFVIFISDFSSTAIIGSKTDAIISSKSARFKKGVDMARAYSRVKTGKIQILQTIISSYNNLKIQAYELYYHR